MSVLIDTTIWSLALRRRRYDLNADEQIIVEEWARLIREGRADLIGPIRQETLSGIRHEVEFERLRRELSHFRDVELNAADYEEAARNFNTCRSNGITATSTDMLICTVAIRLEIAIFTTDRDFPRYAQYLPIELHQLPDATAKQ